MLRHLSVEWIAESARAEDPEASAPFQDAQLVLDHAIALSLRDAIRGMAT